MSILNNTNIRYAGGAGPAGIEQLLQRHHPLQLAADDHQHAASPTRGGTGGTEAAIAADFDSFREDDTARGP